MKKIHTPKISTMQKKKDTSKPNYRKSIRRKKRLKKQFKKYNQLPMRRVMIDAHLLKWIAY